MLTLGNSSNCHGQGLNGAQQVMSPVGITTASHAFALGHHLPIVFQYISFPGFSLCYNYAFYYYQYFLFLLLLAYVLSSYRDPYDLIYSFVSFLCLGLYLSQYTIAPIKSYVTNLTSSIYQNFIRLVTLNSWHTSPVTTHFGLIAMTKDANFSRDTWIIDSGCTTHICCQKELFTELVYERGTTLSGIAGTITIAGRGTVTLGNNTIYNVAYAPSLPFNLFSVSQCTAVTGNTFVFTRKSVSVVHPEGSSFRCGTAKRGLYIFDPDLDFSTPELADLVFNTTLDPVDKGLDLIPNGSTPHVRKAVTLYNRLGQPGTRLYNKLAPIIHAPPLKISTTVSCRECSPGSRMAKHFTRPLQLLDVFIFSGPNADSQAVYLFAQDRFSKYTVVSPIKNISSVARCLPHLISTLEKDLQSRGRKLSVSAVHTPNIGAFHNARLHNFFKARNIKHYFRNSYSRLQNYDTEYFSKVQEMANAMMRRAGAPAHLWTDALQSAVFTLNRLPIAGKDSGIPFCLFVGIPSSQLSIYNLHIFGCSVTARPSRKYLKSRCVTSITNSNTITGAFIGYVPQIRGYKVYDYLACKTFITKDLEFDERIFPLARHSYISTTQNSTTFISDGSQDYTHHHLKQTEVPKISRIITSELPDSSSTSTSSTRTDSLATTDQLFDDPSCHDSASEITTTNSFDGSPFPRPPPRHDYPLSVLPAEVGELGPSVSIPANERAIVLPTDEISPEGSTLEFTKDCLSSDHETSDATVSSTIHEYLKHSEMSEQLSTTHASPARIPNTKFRGEDLNLHSIEVSGPGDTPALVKDGECTTYISSATSVRATHSNEMADFSTHESPTEPHTLLTTDQHEPTTSLPETTPHEMSQIKTEEPSLINPDFVTEEANYYVKDHQIQGGMHIPIYVPVPLFIKVPIFICDATTEASMKCSDKETDDAQNDATSPEPTLDEW